MSSGVSVKGGIVGKTVEWEKSGRGRGEFARGKVLATVASGTTNKEAMEIVSDHYAEDYIFRKSYNQFAEETQRSERAIVAVKREDTKRARPAHNFYAPNQAEIMAV